jgi:hypothetical protein
MKRCWVSLALFFACEGGDDGDVGKLEIVTGSLPDVELNRSYDQKIEAKGGKAPYTFELESGGLPGGLDLAASTGQIMGIAVEPGRATFRVLLTDSDGASVAKELSIYVVPEKLEIVTTVLPQGKESEPYDQVLVARGGIQPHTFSLDSGALPSGIELVASGRIQGTPSGSGGFDFSVKVTDAEENEATQMLHLFLVSQNPMITTSTIPKARRGEPYSVTLAAQGGTPPYSWEPLTGSLPDGLQLANDGSLTGVPSEDGEFQFTARVTDGRLNEDMAGFTLRVLAPLEITTTSLPQIILGRSIDFSMTASGGEPPYTWSVDGTLPVGVTFEPSGRISGSSNDVGVHPLTIRVTDADGWEDSGLFDLRVTDRWVFEVEPMAAFPPTCSSTASSVNVEIPVAHSMSIEDLDVAVTLTYTNQGGGSVANSELKVVLFSPGFEAQAPLCGDGAEIPGGHECPGFGGIDRLYDDEGGFADRPDRPLGAFDGLNPQGTWVLRVTVATPSCNRSGVVERVMLSIRDDRSSDEYVIVRGYTRNNLVLAPWVRLTTGNDGGLDQHDIYLTATIYSTGPNGVREAGMGDDVPEPVPLTWQLTGPAIPGGTSITNDGHVTAGSITGETTITASGGGYVVNVPLYVTPPDWNPLVRVP